MLDPEHIRVDLAHDKPSSGMWHCGPNACWVTVTHLPTLMQVRVYSGDRSQHQARNEAMTLMEMMLDRFGDEPCQFPDVLETAHA